MRAPPAVHQLRVDAGALERTLSQHIREERQDLREAAEQTLNMIMDLSLSGLVRWVSPSWKDVVGTAPEEVQGKPIQDLLLGDNKDIFSQAVESMQKDDTRSQIIRFTLELGPASKLLQRPNLESEDGSLEGLGEEPTGEGYGTIDLEGQGIMVYDRSSGGESHVSTVSTEGRPRSNLSLRLCG